MDDCDLVKRLKYLERRRLSHKKNKEKERIAGKKYRAENKDSIRENRRKYYAENVNRFSGYNKRFNKSPKGRFFVYSNAAKRRGIPFDLTFDKFMVYWEKPCTYCGGEIDTVGLDRIDNEAGYVDGNITTCCHVCNWMKRSLSVFEFIDHCRKVVGLNFAF